MKILAALGRVLSDGIVWGFYGAFTIAVIGGIAGMLHGLVFNVLFVPFQLVDLDTAFFLCCFSVLGGVMIGAGVGAVALAVAGIHRSALAHFRFSPLIEVDFMFNAAGATQGSFFCSFAGASTGAVLGLFCGFTFHTFNWRIVDAFAAGYALGAITGFTLGALVGALLPERVAYLREQMGHLGNARRRWMCGRVSPTP
jgi:hypothetical protein